MQINPIVKKDLKVLSRSMKIAWAIFAFEAVLGMDRQKLEESIPVDPENMDDVDLTPYMQSTSSNNVSSNAASVSVAEAVSGNVAHAVDESWLSRSLSFY